MFEFTNKARNLALGLTVVGALLWALGFAMNGGGAHGDDHGHDTHQVEQHDAHAADAHDAHGHDAHAEAGHDDHGDHAAHQIANRPWSALYTAAYFFLGIGLGALFFLGIQYVAQAGWSVGVLRVMEAMSLWITIPLIVLAVVAGLGLTHTHHMWHWMAEGVMTEGHPNFDEILKKKEAFLNAGFFMARILIYMIGWIWAAKLLRKNSLLSDSGNGDEMWKKNRKIAAIFTVFYAVTSSTSAWDLTMSLDAHWFSTLWGWYNFAGMFVSSLAVMVLITLYLKSKGLMEWVNENHIHDLGKFMFAFSVFWTYLWFSQYVLIWYANIPEEVVYYQQRFEQFKVPFFIMLALNFVLPFLAVLSRPAKRVPGTLVMAAIFVLVGHYMDHYIMVMPATVGEYYSFGLVELGPILFFTGLFILIVFRQLASAPLLHKNHPMRVESEHFQQ